MANKKNKKRIMRNRSSRIWIETLEQRQLLAPIFGSPDTAGIESLNPGSISLMRDATLTLPPEGLNIPTASTGKGVKFPLGLDTASDGLIVKII